MMKKTLMLTISMTNSKSIFHTVAWTGIILLISRKLGTLINRNEITMHPLSPLLQEVLLARILKVRRRLVPMLMNGKRVEKWKTRQQKKGLLTKEDGGNDRGDEDDYLLAEARQPLWRKVPLPSSLISPYRIVIILRLIILGFFFRFRILNPAYDAYPLWLISVICEIWFGFSWILDQFPKWNPIHRETYLDRLSIRFEREGEPSRLAPVDVFVSSVDPLKEPPIITANTVMSILAVDYPVEKVSCYVSDDGASMLLFDTLAETSEFARRWVPFCKKYGIEPRAPEFYFSEKIDYLKDKVQPTFVKDRRAMKRV